MDLRFFAPGNAHDRRVARRAAMRDQPSRFEVGDTARVTVAEYGKRYKGCVVTILGPSGEPNYWEAQSNKRKAPLIVADEHLDKIDTKKEAA